MPFGGLLTVGLIGAAGSLGGAAISSNAAGNAGSEILNIGNQVGGSLNKATAGGINAGYAGITQANSALNAGLTGATGAINTGVTGANNELNSLLSPYVNAGGGALSSLAGGLAPGGSLSTPISPNMLTDDPGYQFRLQQGLQAIEHSAAANGGAMGGATVKAEDRYAQDYASSEYQNAFNRALVGRQQQFNMLSGLAGLGYGGATNLGERASSNIMTGAGTLASANLGTGSALANTAMQGNQYVGNIGLEGANLAGNAYMGGALGNAAGTIASGNAWGNALSNSASSLGGLLLLNGWNNATSGSTGIGAIDNTISMPTTPPTFPGGII